MNRSFLDVSFVQSDQLIEAGLFHVQLLHGGHGGDFLVLPSLVDCNPVVWEIKLWPSQMFASGLGSSNPFRWAFAMVRRSLSAMVESTSIRILLTISIIPRCISPYWPKSIRVVGIQGCVYCPRQPAGSPIPASLQACSAPDGQATSDRGGHPLASSCGASCIQVARNLCRFTSQK